MDNIIIRVILLFLLMGLLGGLVGGLTVSLGNPFHCHCKPHVSHDDLDEQ